MNTDLIIFLSVFAAIPAVPVVLHLLNGRRHGSTSQRAAVFTTDDSEEHVAQARANAQRANWIIRQGRESERQAALSQFAAGDQSEPLHSYWASIAFRPPEQ